MEYLGQQNKLLGGEVVAKNELINAKDKNVLVIGGGDTGSDCVGTANRQGARSITQIEILPKPPVERTENMPWPNWPTLLKNSSSHQEGCERLWNITTKKFSGKAGQVEKAQAMKVEWHNGKMQDVPGSEFEIKADLVLLALGFTQPVHDGLLTELGLEFDTRGNVKVDDNYMSSVKGVFSAGDTVRGASLVVWAMQTGRLAAKAIDRYLR
jgi:glutamate synthase (NADPH/NADH) small chain